MKTKTLICLRGWLVLALGVGLFAPQTQAQYDDGPSEQAITPERSFEYTQEMRDNLRLLPVQDGGRIKPMGTLADFKLLKFNGRRTIKTEGFALEDKLSPEEWLLDCFFFPEQAKRYEVFILDDKKLAVAIGLDLASKKKRDRYSFNEIESVRQTMFSRASSVFNKEADSRSPLEKQVLLLWRKFAELEDLMAFAQFAGVQMPTSNLPQIADLYQGEDVELPQYLARADAFRNRLTGEESGPAWEGFNRVLQAMSYRSFQGLGVLPPTANAEEAPEWLAWPELVPLCLSGDEAAMGKLPMLEALGDVAKATDNAEAFGSRLAAFTGMVKERAEARGEYATVPMEVNFYKFDFFYRALYAFVLGFLLVCFSWLRTGAEGKGKWLVRASWIATSIGLILLVAGITYRCILRSRPPISTLYETILFIAGVMVIVGLFLEWANRRRAGLALSALLGAFGMFLAGRYELREAATAGDTMPALQAVLDTNFWLATHVTVINIGYAAGLLAAALGHVWMLSFFFGKGRTERSGLNELSRMIYGVLCFSLLFSVVGTILGGVWANDSWGRFWGWDPKENGALLICIWEILILHARMAGWIRNFGLAAMNILLGCVVAFSWWGVNLLNVGLHTYGFTEGVGFWLTVFYVVEVGIVLLALVGKMIRDAQEAPTEIA